MKILILFIFAVVAAASAHKCMPISQYCEGAHKVYSRCNGNPACQHNCDNPDGSIICTKNCVEGCVCKEGYIEDANRNCIKPDECPVKPFCPAAEHKIYTECNAQCPIKTCEDPAGPMICPLICVSGCVCEDGYVQDKDGNCVTIDACPAVQPFCPAAEHKVYTECDAGCLKTCENPNPMICPAVCMSGCVCEDGYVQDANGNCVTIDACPAVQPICSAADHKVFSECGANPSCQANCDNYGGPIRCSRICINGCVCEEGYIEDGNGNCIRPNECPPIELVP